jgi:hypothetical protein
MVTSHAQSKHSALSVDCANRLVYPKKAGCLFENGTVSASLNMVFPIIEPLGIPTHIQETQV